MDISIEELARLEALAADCSDDSDESSSSSSSEDEEEENVKESVSGEGDIPIFAFEEISSQLEVAD